MPNKLYVTLADMTEAERIQLKKFEARIHRFIAEYRTLQKENSDLYAELESRDKEINKLKAELAKNKKDYSNLKLAKMMEISDSDIKETKNRVTQLVREVNKCINILSASEEKDIKEK